MPAKIRSVNVPRLYALWADHSLTVTEVARSLGVDIKYLYTLADRHKLPKRPRLSRCDSFDAVNTPEEDEASSASLQLSPYVKRQIKILRLGMPQMEHPDVSPWFSVTTEPGPYDDEPEDGYAYDE